MKIIAAILTALCSLACSAAAQAPPASTTWTDPLGRFTIDFAANGFTPLPATGDPADVLAVEHGALQRSANAVRMCGVREQPVPRLPALDQGQANAHLYARSEAQTRASIRGELSEYARTRIDGVSTISFRLDVGGFQQYWRTFYLARDGGVIQVSLACGGAAPLSMLETSIMNQTLSTLRFLPEAAP
jgi:hypothetical protein